MPATTATPNLLQEPGYLHWAPLGTALPTHTVAGSKFTDTWPAAWINLGATEDGSTFKSETKVEPVKVAEFFDPIKYVTTERSGSFSAALASYTFSNLAKAMNGAANVIVSGTGATQLNKLTPPAPGSEVRCMIGWESLDATLRIVAYQTFQGGAVASDFKKAPAKALIAVEFMFEVPTSGVPFEMWSAGTARA